MLEQNVVATFADDIAIMAIGKNNRTYAAKKWHFFAAYVGC
jgi:hypothetical protein